MLWKGVCIEISISIWIPFGSESLRVFDGKASLSVVCDFDRGLCTVYSMILRTSRNSLYN
jgi:hypothetical protein